MTNIKRVLSLALAAVMLMGMMVIGAGAANVEYTDAESIENAEAVELLTALDVLGGYPDGSFKPEGTITRAEAAAIICRIMLGADVAESLSTDTAPFADVKATNWAAGYLSYLKNLGVISGIGNNKFNPQGEVTVGEFAKMLLGAAGIEGKYTGSQWLINVTVAAQKANILDSSDKVTDAATRDAAAGYTMNALFVGEDVTTTSTKYLVSVTDTGNTTTTIYDKYEDAKAAVNTASDAGKPASMTSITVSETTTKDSLADTVFKLKKLTDGVTDNFGRPATAYELNGKEIAKFANDAALTYTTSVTGGDLYTALGKPSGTLTVTYVVNGKTESATFAIASGNTVSIGGNGTLTEVYKTGDKAYKVVVIGTYLGTVATHGDAVKDANGDVTTKEYITITAGTKNPGTLANAGKFETDAFAKADQNKTLVLYTAAWNSTNSNYDVKTVELPKMIENLSVTGYNTSTGKETVTAGGVTYSYGANNEVTGTYTMDGVATYTLYLDSYGYVVQKADYTAAGATNYSYVIAAGTPTQDDFASKWDVNYQVIDTTGTISVIKVKEADRTADLAAGDIITYVDDSDNAGFVKTTKTAAVDTTKGYQTASVSALNKTSPVIGTNIVANASTVFVLKTGTDKWTVYTGIAALPTYTSLRSATAYSYVGTDGYADVVFMDVTSGTPGTSTADDLVYLLEYTSTDARYDATNKVTYYAFDAIVDGVVTEIFSTEATLENSSDADLSAIGLAKIVKYDRYGYVEAADLITSTGIYEIKTLSSKTVSYSAPTLTVDNTSYLTSDSTVVYYYNTTSKSLTVGTAADLVGTLTGSMSIIDVSATDATVSAIYFYGTIA